VDDVGTIRDITVGFLSSPWGWAAIAAAVVLVVVLVRR
jgi:hypothetical protein